MRIAGMVQDSIVDGPGLRFAVFTQGCPHLCPGCHNPGTHSFTGGTELSVDEVCDQMLKNPLTDGLTLSGGEPFSQAGDCARLAAAAKKAGLNVWIYTGWTFEELLDGPEPGFNDLLQNTDVLVDGRFEISQRTLSLPWRGSLNQRIIDVRASLEQRGAVQLNMKGD